MTVAEQLRELDDELAEEAADELDRLRAVIDYWCATPGNKRTHEWWMKWDAMIAPYRPNRNVIISAAAE